LSSSPPLMADHKLINNNQWKLL